MDGAHKAGHSGVERSKGSKGVLGADLAKQDMVRRDPHQMIIDLAPADHAATGTGFTGGNQTIAIPELLDMKLWRVLDRQHTTGWIDGGKQHVEQGGLAGVGCPANDHVGIPRHLIDQIVADGWCHPGLFPGRGERMFATDRKAEV